MRITANRRDNNCIWKQMQVAPKGGANPQR